MFDYWWPNDIRRDSVILEEQKGYVEPQGLVERRLSEARVERVSGIKISLSKRRCSGIQI